MLRLIVSLVLAAFLLLPAAARADWREASSKHFIVYSEGSEEDLRAAITKLEKYFFMLRFVSGAQERRVPKVRVFMLRDMRAVADAMPYRGSGVAGFYNATERGPFAVTVRIVESDDNQFSQQVLFHELAHHFMFQYFPATYPSWYSEGFAEYYGTARFFPDDTIEVGHGVSDRYWSFWSNRWLPVSKLLTAKRYRDVGGYIDLLYAEGWLLVHYLANNKERRGQLTKYLNAINAGKSYKQAMDEAFGPGGGKLNSELHAYSRKRTIMAYRMPFRPIDVGEIAIRPLRAAENAMLRHDLALDAGVMRSNAAQFIREVRESAKPFPRDPYALRILAEAERAAGNNAAAAEAVDRWLAARPNDPLALMHKGWLQAAALRAAGNADPAAWDAARQPIIAANKAAPLTPQILYAYYDSFVLQGVLPPPGAQNGLVKAFELIPQDENLRYKVAADFERRDMIAEAVAVIRPLAFSAHAPETDPEKKKKQDARREKLRLVGDDLTETPAEMYQRLEAKLAAKGGGEADAPAES